MFVQWVRKNSFPVFHYKSKATQATTGQEAEATVLVYTALPSKGHSVRKESEMLRLKQITRFAAFLGALVASASSAHATDIGGTISSTLTITEDSQLVDDVTCTVTGVPCVAIGAPNVTLELNGFTMTGQADPQTGCQGGPSTFPAVLEDGIDVNAQTGVTIHGPGLVQRFRGPGIYAYNNSNRLTVTGVTVSTTCFSGILIGGGSEHDIKDNVTVRNGNSGFPCGGI
jgi:hypothetical protein